MPDSSLPSAPAIPSALAAFLRGIERRAYVFAHVQCGSERDAETALARTIHGFRTLSGVSPLSGWPAGFWSLLLAQPELSAGEGGVPELVTLGSGPRAALLLRLVAGLDFAHAAQVLGVSEDTYRYALQRGLQQLGEAGVSYATLRALRDRLHRQVKTLPAERTDALAALRQRALADGPIEVPADAAAPERTGPRRLLWVAFAVLALAFLATFLDLRPSLAPGRTEGLPADDVAPADGTASASDIVMHPDYAQLADPDADRVARDLALLSWLANHPEVLAEAALQAAPATGAAPDAAAPDPAAATAPGGSDAPPAGEEDPDAR